MTSHQLLRRLARTIRIIVLLLFGTVLMGYVIITSYPCFLIKPGTTGCL